MIFDLTTFTDYMPTAIGSKTAELAPYQMIAETNFINKVVGQTLYDNIGALPSDNALKKICLYFLANDIYFEAIPYVNLIQTPNGFAVVSNQNQAPASKDRTDSLREQVARVRDMYLGLIIDTISTNADYLALWKGSEAYNSITALLFYHGTDGKMINYTSIDFEQFRAELLSIQQTKISRIISAEFLSELLTKRASGTPFSKNEKFVFLLIRLMASVHCAPDMPNDNTYEIKAKIRFETITLDLLRFLDENIADFPTYQSSKEYVARTAGIWENKKENTIFFGPC